MTELTYQAYQNDGLELFIANDGSVSASQSAMARMLGMQQGHLSSVLKRPILPQSTKIEQGTLVKLPCATGTRDQLLYGVDTITTLAARFNPELSKRFAEMGATVYLYKLAGYKFEAIDTSARKEETYADHLKTAHAALEKLMNIHRFAEDKPGLEAYLELAEAPKKNALSGKMTLQEMADYYGVSLTPEHSRQLGRSLAGASRSQEQSEPTMVRKRAKSPAGNHQSYMVTEFSVDYLPLFESLCVAYQLV